MSPSLDISLCFCKNSHRFVILSLRKQAKNPHFKFKGDFKAVDTSFSMTNGVKFTQKRKKFVNFLNESK